MEPKEGNRMSDKEVKEIMQAIINLEEVKMKLVKEQNFSDAGILRTAQKYLRELIKDNPTPSRP